jgi:alkylhydroperoxidase/carboxymuconolactone decarboxylase family protein YurZ
MVRRESAVKETPEQYLDGLREAGARIEHELLGQPASEEHGEVMRLLRDTELEFCWGTIWARPAISARTRAALALGMTAALQQDEGVRVATRAALKAGWSAAEIGEILLHVQCYGGLYSAQSAGKAAEAVIAELAPEIEGSQRPATQATREGLAGESDEKYTKNQLARRGLRIRREALGAKDIDGWMRRIEDNKFMSLFFEITHEYCFGKIWARAVLEPRLRSMLSLTSTAARGLTGAIRRHTRSAVEAGLSKREIGEIFLHVYVYGGVYSALHSFMTADEVFAELEREGKTVPEEPAPGTPPL